MLNILLHLVAIGLLIWLAVRLNQLHANDKLMQRILELQKEIKQLEKYRDKQPLSAGKIRRLEYLRHELSRLIDDLNIHSG